MPVKTANRLVGLAVARLLGEGCSGVSVGTMDNRYGFIASKGGDTFALEISEKEIVDAALDANAWLDKLASTFNENFATVQKLKSAHIAPMSTTVN